jgi:acyl carrier protein
MTERNELQPSDITELLASFRADTDRSGDEHIDSLELAWLLHQVEQRYGVELDLDDEQIVLMSTVADASRVFNEAIAGGGSG